MKFIYVYLNIFEFFYLIMFCVSLVEIGLVILEKKVKSEKFIEGWIDGWMDDR